MTVIAPLDLDMRTPLPLWRGKVVQDWLDYNGHMTEARYLHVFGESSDALYAHLGVDFAAAQTGAFFTLETHIRHRAEAKLGTGLYTTTEILGYDARKLHLWHALYDEADQLLATGEHFCLHMAHGKPAPIGAEMLGKIADIFNGQADLIWPDGAGLVLSVALPHARVPTKN